MGYRIITIAARRDRPTSVGRFVFATYAQAKAHLDHDWPEELPDHLGRAVVAATQSKVTHFWRIPARVGGATPIAFHYPPRY